MKKSKSYTKDDLLTDLDWFCGFGVSKVEAARYIHSLLCSTADEEAELILKVTDLSSKLKVKK